MKPQQQTPPTSTEYVEPLGFIGSKGQWKISATMKGDTYQCHTGGDSETLFGITLNQETHSAAMADMQIIQQTKNLAKALQDMIHVATETTANLVGFDGAEELDNTIDAAKKVLQDAGLTDK